MSSTYFQLSCGTIVPEAEIRAITCVRDTDTQHKKYRLVLTGGESIFKITEAEYRKLSEWLECSGQTKLIKVG